MKRLIVIMAFAGLLALAGCAQSQSPAPSTGDSSPIAPSNYSVAGSSAEFASSSGHAASSSAAADMDSEEGASAVVVSAGDTALDMTPADIDAARELIDKLQEGPIVVGLHEYGGFEKVGPLPWALPQSDERVTTSPGDVMLYQGDQITIFTGSNSWAYTPLGHIDGATADSLLAAFGDGDAEITLSLR